ncbi:MAG: FAD-binding oxidoreductase, partial [Nitrososphaerota archaeon]|nr:FAD-binding oxidoreductase [Nitrososphaerota archaeon]
WILSIRLILPSGNVVNLGEPLYKNRAGYDLLHLIVGSEGTLGIVTEAKLKIIPIPQVAVQRSLVYFDSTASVGRSIHALRESRIVPLLFEFMDRETIRLVNQDVESKFDEAEAVLLLDIETQDAGRVEEILRANGATKIQIAQNEKEAESFYQARAMAYLSIKGSATGDHSEDVVVPIDRLAEYLGTLKTIAQEFDLRIPVMGHVGDGNLHPNILYDKSNENEIARAKMAVEEICRAAIKIGGSVTGEHGVGTQKVSLFREQLLDHNGSKTLELMKGVKELFDKNSIMNPGKYVEAA